MSTMPIKDNRLVNHVVNLDKQIPNYSAIIVNKFRELISHINGILKSYWNDTKTQMEQISMGNNIVPRQLPNKPLQSGGSRGSTRKKQNKKLKTLKRR